MIQVYDILPLPEGAGSSEDVAMPFEVVVCENRFVKIELFDDFAVVIADSDWGVGGDSEGEAMMGFAPAAELFDEVGGKVIGEPDVIFVIFGGFFRVRSAIDEGEFVFVLEEIYSLTASLALLCHLSSLHETGGVSRFGVLYGGDLFHF